MIVVMTILTESQGHVDIIDDETQRTHMTKEKGSYTPYFMLRARRLIGQVTRLYYYGPDLRTSI
ncbi:hypothetical protein [Paenibacillus sp. W2I17]|uniref:hypothetical protein n=1 Tax=Paenibacillus sp. W2I17 TaxID=3042311 RepID=UPI002787F752|nr:hypothetical protein [Paenibacillus sp. W2I17]MDQ0656198.1 hypothetical protein [Paenibacillus sp. W2I17]